MKRSTQYKLCCIPLFMIFVIIPIVVKVKFIANPLMDAAWYYGDAANADFFLYYKSQLIIITGILMIVLLSWQIGQMRNKNSLIGADTRIFIPVLIYLTLTIVSSLFSEYGYFCINGMPDQYESVWTLMAYIIIAIYSYYVLAYQDNDKNILRMIYLGVLLVSIICVLQFFKIDIYRLIYADAGYSFTFDEGTVYGPFYNINYVGSYVLLFLPLFILMIRFGKNNKIRLLSALMTIFLLISMLGAKSITSIGAALAVVIFAVLFLLIKNASERRVMWILVVVICVSIIAGLIVISPIINSYVQASDTEKTNLEEIITHDDHVEIKYKGQSLNISTISYGDGAAVNFNLKDQNGMPISCTSDYTEDDYLYYQITDERFGGMTLTPILFSENPDVYGFSIQIDDMSWNFSNQVSDDGIYYCYTYSGKWTKMTGDAGISDFEPLSHMSGLASGRGYIWNKSIMLLKDYIILGSGADTYALVFPNEDYVDMYNNGYAGLFLTKPHNLYLQIGIQSGALSMIAFLVFYIWYFVSSLRLYYRQKFNQLLTVIGFAIMLGTAGYMIAGLANDSSVTVAPLYWALMGSGIAINQRIRTAKE